MITGMVSIWGTLVIFKENAIYQLLGNSTANYTLRLISKGIGCIAPLSIATADGAIYFLSRDGVYTFDGASAPVHISFNVDPLLIPSGATQLKMLAAAFIHRNRYYLAYDSSTGNSANDRTLVYHIDMGCWTVNTSTPYQCLSVWSSGSDKGDVYAGSSSSDGLVYRIEDESLPTDSGTKISMTIIPRDLYGEDISSFKLGRWWMMVTEGSSGKTAISEAPFVGFLPDPDNYDVGAVGSSTYTTHFLQKRRMISSSNALINYMRLRLYIVLADNTNVPLYLHRFAIGYTILRIPTDEFAT
jgi:hypothetical protein